MSQLKKKKKHMSKIYLTGKMKLIIKKYITTDEFICMHKLTKKKKIESQRYKSSLPSGRFL